eukprot:Anaeramoba_flamelloidesa568428_45.p1 GENE.a568428_45~~a568428_45.p1  ORF type:complete len:473 (-),score=98.17 a568428_45:102-1520(-)
MSELSLFLINNTRDLKLIKTFGMLSSLDPPLSIFVSSKMGLPDEAFSECQLCSSNFTTTKRRHHCRHCGLLICSSCCTNSYEFPSKGSQRVCDCCYTLLNEKVSEKLPGVVSIAVQEGWVNRENYQIKDQPLYAITFFTQLLVTNHAQVHKLVLEVLIKFTSATAPAIILPSDLFESLLEIVNLINHPHRILAFEVLANTMAKPNDEVRKMIVETNGMVDMFLGTFAILKNRNANTNLKRSVGRFLFNWICFSGQEITALEPIQERHMISLIQTLADHTNETSILALVLGCISYLCKIDKLRLTITGCGGPSCLMALLARSNPKTPDVILFYLTEILAILSKYKENLDPIFSYGIEHIYNVINLTEVSRVLFNVIGFIGNIGMIHQNDKRLIQSKKLILFIVSVFQKVDFEKSIKLKTLKLLEKFAKFENIRNYLIENQTLTLIDVIIETDRRGLGLLATGTRKSLMMQNEN